MQANNVVPRPITAPIFQLPLRGLEIQGEFKVSSLKGDATRRIARFVRNKEQLSDSSCTLTSVMHMPPIGFPSAVVEYLQPTPQTTEIRFRWWCTQQDPHDPANE